MFTRMAGFPLIKKLDDFDFMFAKGVPKKMVIELATLAFIEQKYNQAFKKVLNWDPHRQLCLRFPNIEDSSVVLKF